MTSTAPRILIVDDSAFMRFMLQKILTDAGFDVVGEATDGSEGAELYKTLRPDVVTMDITMPILSGLEGLNRILRIDPEARVIMISAMGQKSTVLKALQSGALGFIVKPFDKIKVIDTVRDVLAFSHKSTEPPTFPDPAPPSREDA
ncbi:response regulator [Aminiphilus circumscriptus]|uniref:response regulator n=1 Tax=Aminiphilus circumscriptus TaxID=290732 RepID=UPI000478602B|nr:response regulator [Aminiphilus circumscriptus]